MVDPDSDNGWLPPDAGDIGTVIRAFDWSSTELGPLNAWPVGLRTIVSVMLESENVMSLVWGDDAILIYNDAFANRLLPPQWRVNALGASAYTTFGTHESSFAADIAAGMAGQSRQVNGKRYPVLRGGVVEDAWFNVTYAPVRDAEGEVGGVLWTLIEITEQWQAQETLRESEARSRTLIGSWAQAVWETDPDGVVIADSPSWRAYTGQTLQEWLGYGWLDAIHPDDREYTERQWRAAVGVEGLFDAECRLRAPDGGWCWTNVRATPVRDADGRILKWVGMNIDIDVRKRIEATLRESEARLQLASDAAKLGIYEWDLITDQVTANDEFKAMVGVKPDERFVGAMVLDRGVHAEDRVRVEAAIADAVNGDKAGQFIFEHRLGVGDATGERWVLSHGQVYFGEDEKRLHRIFGALQDITERKHAEAALQENQERQAFLLQLSDVLRGETGEEQVQLKALEMLAEHLRADRTYITTSDYEAGFTEVPAEVCRTGAPPLKGKFWHSDYPESSQAVNEGTMVIHNVGTDPNLSAINQQSFAGFGIGAVVGVGLRKGVSNIFWTLAVAMDKPRQWTAGEVLTLEQAAERAWTAMQRARNEAAWRESEERFRQFGRASSDGLWIRDAATLKLEYASDAMETIYGLSIAAMTADPLAWPALIVPEDRDETFGYIERVKAGESVVHEFRIQRATDLTFRWIRSVGFPLLDEKGAVTRIAGISSDITEEKILAEHQSVLLHELQHRVRNIMGVIRSIGNRSAVGATGVEDYRQTLEGRMLALARVQTLLTREANTGASLRDIIESEVKVQAHHPHQYELVGTDVMLSPKAVEVLTMAFHELSTNALKYGAFSVSEGRLTVSWSKFERHGSAWLAIDWVETGAPQPQTFMRRGFGSELIEGRIPYELGGIGKLTIESTGARCRMEFPLKFAESILETDAPMPTTTFGGTIDMSGAPDLSGCVILVVEDDYYLAADTVAALRGAGAEVLGPCPSEEATRDLLEASTPTHAVVDLNLGGGGPRFEIAQLLKEKGVPFVFLTGYDPDVIPTDFADVPRLQKPVPFRTIVEAVSLLL